jgi:hypothetical protein
MAPKRYCRGYVHARKARLQVNEKEKLQGKQGMTSIPTKATTNLAFGAMQRQIYTLLIDVSSLRSMLN